MAAMYVCAVFTPALRWLGRRWPAEQEHLWKRVTLHFGFSAIFAVVTSAIEPPLLIAIGVFPAVQTARWADRHPDPQWVGQLIAYAGRAINRQEPKYRFPARFRKSLVLFNLHRAIATKARTVVVVEGFFDAIAVHQAGYPAVVALMGSTLPVFQAELLKRQFGRIVLMTVTRQVIRGLSP
jgi:hypothetical protein